MAVWLMLVGAALSPACGSNDDDDDSGDGDADVDAGDTPDTGPTNQDPVIASLEGDKEAVPGGGVVTITVVASDPDGDELELAWSASTGTLDTEEGPGPVAWTAPDERGTGTITVTVTDGNGGSAEQALDLGVLGWVDAAGTDDLPTGKPLKNIAFLTPDEGWAVGGSETDNVPYLFHLTGGAWEEETPGLVGHMHGLAVLGENDAWMIGGEGLGYHLDAEGWGVLHVPGGCVHGMDFLGPDDGWVTPAHGQVGMRHWTGGDLADWVEVETPENAGLNGVGMIAADDGFAVGADGIIVRYDGEGWVEVDSPASDALNDVDMIDATDGWIVGDDGTLLRFDGDEWESFDSPVDEILHAVHALDAGNVWAVGDSGTILFFDGSDWSQMDASTEADLYGVFAVGPGDVWAVGDGSTILHLE